MFLDMDGNLKEIPKKKKGRKLSRKKFSDTIAKLMQENTDKYCLFYSKNGIVYRAANCSKECINDFIMYNKQLELENTIYQCIDLYFYQEECDDQQDLLDKIIEELNNKQDKDQDD